MIVFLHFLHYFNEHKSHKKETNSPFWMSTYFEHFLKFIFSIFLNKIDTSDLKIK